MVLDIALLSTQNYKIKTKSKVEQSRKWSSVVAVEKGAFRSSLTKVTNFTYYY